MAGLQDYLASIANPGVAPPAAPPLPVPAPAAAPQVAQPSFVEALTNPTGNPALLMDMAARFSRAPQPGQSTTGAVVGGANEALQSHQQRVAQKAATKLSTRGAEVDIATKERTLESADLRDEKLQSEIDLNKRLPKDASGAGSSKLRILNAKAEDLLKNHPETYRDFNEAREAAVKQDHFFDVEMKRAQAIADYYTNRAILRSPEEIETDLADIKNRFDALSQQATVDPIQDDPKLPGTSAQPQGLTPQLADQIAAMDLPQFTTWAKQRNPNADEATIKAAFDETRGATSTAAPTRPKAQPKAKAKAKPNTSGKSRRGNRASIVRKKVEAKKQKADSAAIAKSEFKVEVPNMERQELQVWLERHREHLTGPQRRSIQKRLKKLAKG